MEKFKKELEEIRALYKEITETENKMKDERDSYYKTIKSFDSLNEKKAYKAETDFLNKQMEMSEKIVNGKIKLKLMEHNARLTLFEEVMPVVLEVLQKYNGKPYGEKTSKKIRDEIFDKTNCYVYLRSDSLHISSNYTYGNTYDLEVHTKNYNDKILVDNKIHLFGIENFVIAYHLEERYENLDNAVKQLKELKKLAKQKQDELMEICSQFNNLAPKGIANLDYAKWIYDSFF